MSDRVAIDFDDTLADYMGLYRLAASFSSCKEIYPDDIKSWEWPIQYGHERFIWFTKFIHTKENILYLKPHEAADIAWIYRKFWTHIGEVFIISHQYSDEAEEAIKLWCQYYLRTDLLECPLNVFIVKRREDKVKKALELNCNIIIDDNVNTCWEAVQAGLVATLIRRPWVRQLPFVADSDKLIIVDSLYAAFKQLYKRRLMSRDVE